ncbi:unnamed protein product, partial [Symbiodinium natans]
MAIELDSDSDCEVLEAPKKRLRGQPSLDAVLRHVYRPRDLPPVAPLLVPQRARAPSPQPRRAEPRSTLKALFRQRREEIQQRGVGETPLGLQERQGERLVESNNADAEGLASLMAQAGLLPALAERLARAARRGEQRGAMARPALRSVVYNLRHNAALVHKVNSGEIAVEALLRMSHLDMAGTSVIARRQRLHQEALRDV